MSSHGWNETPSSSFADLKAIYRLAIRFALMSPALFLVPAFVELFQHYVEVDLGMYESMETFRTLALAPERLASGLAKVIALTLPMYYYCRFLGFNGDVSRYTDFSYSAIKPFIPVFVLNVTLTLLVLSSTSHYPDSNWPAILQLATIPIGLYLTYWTVARALGSNDVSVKDSLITMNGHVLRALGYMVAGFLPLTMLHYLLVYPAIGANGIQLWAVLVLDSVVVAGIAMCMAGAVYFAARWAIQSTLSEE